MQKSSILTTLSAVVLTLPAYALAAESVSTFEQFDTDGNGYISADEASTGSALSANFKATDSNGDGRLDISEFSAFEGQGRLTPPEDAEIPEPGAAPY